jgi:parvulin-like peptidyl-prolyl isomerase
MGMKKNSFLMLLVMVSLQLAAVAADEKDEAVRVDGVAAYVNSHVITYSDVLGASQALQRMVSQKQSGEAVNAQFKRALEAIIERKLILDAYADQELIQIPDQMVEERVQTIIRDVFKNDRWAFLGALAADGQNEAAWREQIREQIVVSAMRNFNVGSHVRVSPVDVRKRYDETLDQQAAPPAVKFSMIVVAIGNSDSERESQARKLESVQQALADGDDFADVARTFSEGSLAENGGARDWVDPEMLRRELRELVLNADLGVVKGPIEIGPHYALVKVDGRRDAKTRAFADAYSDIEKALSADQEERLYQEWITRLRRDAFVRILNENPF